MLKVLKKLILSICIVVLFLSSYKIISYLYSSFNNKSIYRDISTQYHKKYESKEGSNDFLKDINKDIVAWIRLPNTNIDYPVVKGVDNSFYLNHDINGDKSIHGSIFIDYRNKLDEDKNLIIYGHHMKDGTMFKDLVKYKDQDFFEKNKYIHLYIDGKLIEYEIFSVMLVGGSSDYIDINLNSSDEFSQYLDNIIENSLFYRDISFDGSEKLLTLSTCSYEFDNARTVVYGIKHGLLD